MKQNLRLLERIRTRDPNYHGEQLDDMQLRIASVKMYIQKILNTRQGNSILDEEIGIPDYNVMSMNFSENNRSELESQIRSVIEKSEPRLGNVRITLEGVRDPAEGIHFNIEGVIGGENPVFVGFDTVVNNEGKIFLRDIHA
jgi:type VI secretion system protein